MLQPDPQGRMQIITEKKIGLDVNNEGTIVNASQEESKSLTEEQLVQQQQELQNDTAIINYLEQNNININLERVSFPKKYDN